MGKKRRINPWIAKVTVRKDLSIPEVKAIQTIICSVLGRNDSPGKKKKLKISKTIWKKKRVKLLMLQGNNIFSILIITEDDV